MGDCELIMCKLRLLMVNCFGLYYYLALITVSHR